MAGPFDTVRRFFRELKRRNVDKVAVASLAVAFVGIQAAQLLVPPTTLPAWADDLLIYLAVFGFPLALVLRFASTTAFGRRCIRPSVQQVCVAIVIAPHRPT